MLFNKPETLQVNTGYPIHHEKDSLCTVRMNQTLKLAASECNPGIKLPLTCQYIELQHFCGNCLKTVLFSSSDLFPLHLQCYTCTLQGKAKFAAIRL